MKMFLLSSDEDTLIGMRLAGIDGRLVKTDEELQSSAQDVLSRNDIGILLVTRTLSLQFPESVLELKKSSKLLVTEIPDMNNSVAESDSITRYVRDAIGITV